MASHPSPKSKKMDSQLAMPPPTYQEAIHNGIIFEDIPLQDLGPAPLYPGPGQTILQVVAPRQRSAWRPWMWAVGIGGTTLGLACAAVVGSYFLGSGGIRPASATVEITGSIVNTLASAGSMAATVESTSLSASTILFPSAFPSPSPSTSATRQATQTVIAPASTTIRETDSTGPMQSTTFSTGTIGTIGTTKTSPTTSAPRPSGTSAVECPPGLDVHCGI